jgi:GLPGLI family protein
VIITVSKAQNGRITYFAERQVKVLGEDGKQTEQQKAIEEMLRKQQQKTYILEFKGTESLYIEQKKLEEESTGGFHITIIDGSGDLYKSIKEKHFMQTDESLGKRFLIDDKLKPIDWELVDSSKMIQNYLCYKAKYMKIEKDFDTTIKTLVEVWYAPDIPISNGPDKLWGLPGLILELHQGKYSIICQKIELNLNEEIQIKKPKKGKKIKQDEFDRITDEHLKKQMEMYEGGRQKGGGNTIQINIGG